MISINGTNIGYNEKPYIIAELSANHGGSIERAKLSIKAAKSVGVSAVKMQTYTPDTMTIDCEKDDFKMKEGLWQGYSLYHLYKEAYTPYEWHAELFNFARKIGITLFSTPFDESAVDLLLDLNTPAFKIASFELTDLPLIKYAANKLKPMLMSTGMASMDEIAEAVQCCKNEGNHEILLFHCVSSYPARIQDSNLRNIISLANQFGVCVGLSDHTTSNLAASLAISMGAVAIEKHFKLDEKDCGPDSSFSILPNQLKRLVEDCNLSYDAMGSGEFSRSEVEISNKRFRRSLYFVKSMIQGQTITSDDVKRIRPGFGLEPKYLNEVLGKKMMTSVERGDPVKWDDIKMSE